MMDLTCRPPPGSENKSVFMFIDPLLQPAENWFSKMYFETDRSFFKVGKVKQRVKYTYYKKEERVKMKICLLKARRH